MRYLLLIAILLLPSVAIGGESHKVGYVEQEKKEAEQSEEAQRIVEMVEKRFADTFSMKGRFMQRFYDSSMMEEEFSEGLFEIKKPLKMVWRYEKPQPQLVISDGKRLYLYVPEDKQVMIRRVGGLLDSNSPVLFLAGKQRLKEIFHVRLDEKQNADRMDDTFALRLTPKRKNMNVERIYLRVTKEDGTLRSFSIHDWTGNRTDIEFVDFEMNMELDDKGFKFETPEGVEEIELETD